MYNLIPEVFDIDIEAGYESVIKYVKLRNPKTYSLHFKVRADDPRLVKVKPSKGMVAPGKDITLRFTIYNETLNDRRVSVGIMHCITIKKLDSELDYSYNSKADNLSSKSFVMTNSKLSHNMSGLQARNPLRSFQKQSQPEGQYIDYFDTHSQVVNNSNYRPDPTNALAQVNNEVFGNKSGKPSDRREFDLPPNRSFHFSNASSEVRTITQQLNESSHSSDISDQVYQVFITFHLKGKNKSLEVKSKTETISPTLIEELYSTDIKHIGDIGTIADEDLTTGVSTLGSLDLDSSTIKNKFYNNYNRRKKNKGAPDNNERVFNKSAHTSLIRSSQDLISLGVFIIVCYIIIKLL